MPVHNRHPNRIQTHHHGETDREKRSLQSAKTHQLSFETSTLEIHHRQPVILNQSDVNRYLNLELQGSAFLNECKKPDLIFHEVSKEVNKPTNNSVSLIQENKYN